MKKNITCFLPAADENSLKFTIESLLGSGNVDRIYVAGYEDSEPVVKNPDTFFIKSEGFASTHSLKKIARLIKTDFVLLYTNIYPLDLGKHALKRMVHVCKSTGAGMVYSDYFENREGKLAPHPVIDYQEGSLRDDFNFGSVILCRSSSFINACKKMKRMYRYAGLYDLRLKISQKHIILHIPELLYTEVEPDTRKSGEKQFDYVDPKNRAVQIEMEKVCTEHLKKIKAWLKPIFKKISFKSEKFEFEASVVIPVKNRQKTINDAITSVLGQEAEFRFNLIVVDNYSTDGTTEIIRSFATKDDRVIHIVPDRKDLGIGGCWNEAILHEKCGKFAIQLDSDDLYIDKNVISRIVGEFYKQHCAMMVGSYKMVNFKLEEIPPGLIDHKEWTADNGRNNALRINGLGAPRAFYTPVLRDMLLPDVSYGEDYAVGLAISRHFRIGRIYEPLYLCRRWEENSDAALDVNRVNANDHYKDKIRTIELLARKKLLRK